MAFRAYTLTLTGVAQRLSDVYGDGVGVVRAASDIPYRQLVFQATDSNSNDVFFGMNSSVSSTNYGFHLETPAPNAQHSSMPFGPFETGPMKLSEIWVIGTANEKVTIAGVPF